MLGLRSFFARASACAVVRMSQGRYSSLRTFVYARTCKNERVNENERTEFALLANRL